jgi:hypothetical protein
MFLTDGPAWRGVALAVVSRLVASATYRQRMIAAPPLRIWDEHKFALYFSMLDLLMSADDFFQGKARGDHRMELACGE